MIGQIPDLDRGRLVILPLLVLGAGAAGAETVEEDVFPIDFFPVFRFRLLLFLLSYVRLIFVGLLQFEEGVDEQLFLKVLLQLQQGHIEEIHRLIQARIHPQFLLEHRALLHRDLHAAVPKRSRSRLVRVGPK